MQGARSADDGRGREGWRDQRPGDGRPRAARRGHHPEEGAGGERRHGRHPVLAFLRANPQVLVLLVICVVLGLGTFLAVLFGLIAAGNSQTTGEPSGTILVALDGLHGAADVARSLLA